MRPHARSCWRSLGRSPRRDERRWLAGLALVTLCSWGRWAVTGSLKVDENYPHDPAATLLFVALLVGWGLMLAGWRGLLARPSTEPGRLARAGMLVGACMLPVVSNDVFSLLAYGSLAAHGKDVYTTAAALPTSYWYSWIGERWSAEVCVYGPATLASTLPVAWAGHNPWLALAVVKLVWIVPTAVVMEVSLRRLRDRPLFHALVWQNPLFLLEGIGQLHADLLGLTAITAGILLVERRRPVAAWIAFATALFGKYIFVFAAPWFWLAGAPDRARTRAARLVAMAAVVTAVGAALFAPFWRGPRTLLEPIRALSAMNPGGSLTEVAGYVVHLARGGAVAPPDLPVRLAVDFERATKATTWAVVSLVLRAVCVVVGVRALALMKRRASDPDALALGTGVVLVAAVTIASHRFQSWYLLGALPLFGLRCPPVWRRWWWAAVATTATPQFVSLLPRTAAILPVWSALSTAAVMIVFLASFRERFLPASFGPTPDLGTGPAEGDDQSAVGPVSLRPPMTDGVASADTRAPVVDA